MADVKYVCLSDMHLGEEDSLLTNLQVASTKTDPTEPSPVLKTLVECLRHIISQNKGEEKPTLVLCGDILELALCNINEAAMVFERFIQQVMPENDRLFEEIIYLPGNHDHHLWESARETQYVDYISAKIKPNDPLPVPWHTTNIFDKAGDERVSSYFLTRLIRRYPYLKDVNIKVGYPNYGIFKKEKNRSIIFHHGHYIESLYTLISQLKSLILPNRKEPETIWDIEAENFAWIDFFWSTLGRSGEAGEDVELIYEKLHDEKQFDKLIKDLSRNLAERYDLPGWGDSMEQKLVEFAIKKAVGSFSKRERTRTAKPLSDDAEKGLRRYLNGPLWKQMSEEFGGEAKMPSAMTFVFGHTHKAFQQMMTFSGYPYWVRVYNTGGWVVESVETEPMHGGSVVLADKDLNTTAIRIYNEGEYSIRVEGAVHANEQPNPLHKSIDKIVNPKEKPWSDLSEIIGHTVNIRRQNFIKRINEKN